MAYKPISQPTPAQGPTGDYRIPIKAALQSSYENALQEMKRDTQGQQSRSKLASDLTKKLVNSFTSSPLVSSTPAYVSSPSLASIAGPASQASLGYGGSTSVIAPTTMSLGYGGSVGASQAPIGFGAAQALSQGGSVGAGAASTAGSATGSAAAGSAATAGSTLGGALSTTGIGAIVGAGLMIGSSKPGDKLFPLKKFMYNYPTAPAYKYLMGGGFLDNALGKFSPQNLVNSIFGDPNEQERKYQEYLSKTSGMASVLKYAFQGAPASSEAE